MKLLIIAYYYPPINSGGTQRPLKMGKYLARMGHDVVILTHTYGRSKTQTGNPKILRVHDISQNKNRIGFRRKLQWLGLRLYTEVLNKLGIYHSIYHWWCKAAVKQIETLPLQERPDIIIATYPPVETLEIGIALSKKIAVPLIVDFRDGLLFEPIETKRMAQYACIRKEYKKIETAALTQAAAVTTIARPISDYFRDTYHPPQVEVISNAFDTEDLEQVDNQAVTLSKEHFNIVFTGRFGLSEKAKRVDFFFNALRRVIQENPAVTIKMHLVGEYSAEELRELKDLIEAGVVQLHGFVERIKALAYQQAADLLLIITMPDRVSSVSAKIFEYLNSGKPILALTYKTVLADIIVQTQTGWLVHPQQPEEIAKLLTKIITQPDFYNSLKPNRQAIQKYTIKTQIEKLNHLLTLVKR